MSARVDVWYVCTDDVDPVAIDASSRLMAPEERAAHARFVFERNRHEYLVTRGLARGVLAMYANRDPGELSFYRTEHGRPLLSDPGGLSFNLTNTVALVACAVSRDHEIGLDAEPLTRADDVLKVAHTVFTAGERAHLDGLPFAARRRRAVELWTLKEAYIKARSMGFSLPVDRVEMTFSDREGDLPRIAFFPPVDDDPRRWSFVTFEIEGHLVSTCTEVHGPDEPVGIEIHRADLAQMLAPREAQAG
jgi:4'-phosphopantetheinyl transferase